MEQLKAGEIPADKVRKKLVKFLMDGGPSLHALKKGGFDPDQNKGSHGGEKKKSGI